MFYPEYPPSLAQLLNNRNSIGLFHATGEVVIPGPEWDFKDTEFGLLRYTYSLKRDSRLMRVWNIHSRDNVVDLDTEFPLLTVSEVNLPQRPVQIEAVNIRPVPLDSRSFSVNVKLPYPQRDTQQIDVTFDWFAENEEAHATVESRLWISPSVLTTQQFRQNSGIWEPFGSKIDSQAAYLLGYAELTALRLFDAAWLQCSVRPSIGFSWS